MRRCLAFILLLAACGDTNRKEFESRQGPLAEPLPPPQKETCAEAFAETKRAVDIIVSIDQSSSMNEEIDSLKAHINILPSLLAESGLDYRIVMVAEIGLGKYGVCVPPPLGGPDCGPNGTVFRPVDQFVHSMDTLALLLSTLDHPVSTLAWRDFLRPGVLKVFVPITDDDAFDVRAAAFDGELLRRGEGLFGTAASRNYVFFPVIGMNEFPDTRGCSSSSDPGEEYQYLASLTKGKWFSVCRPSLGPILEEIGRATREAVSCEIAIPEPPPGATLDVQRINVQVTASGSPFVVPQDSTHPCASGANGWQFSEDKKKIVLCGDACALVKSNQATKFNVGFGCNTIVR
jgi:hypothetical protein